MVFGTWYLDFPIVLVTLSKGARVLMHNKANVLMLSDKARSDAGNPLD